MTSVPSAHWDHGLPSPSPQEARVWGGCGHPGPLEFTQLRYSPDTPPIPWWVWRRGQLSSQPPSSLGPPSQPGTHGPPHPQPICISKKIRSICFRFIYTSTHHGGGQSRAPCLQALHPHRGAGEHVSCSGTRSSYSLAI